MKLNMIKLAFRNIFRNKRRTGITMSAIIFGAVTIILLGGILECSMDGLREQNIRSVIGGHLKISRDTGDIVTDDLYDQIILGDMLAEIEDILETEDHIKVYATKIDGISGLIGNDLTSATFIADGIDPEKEAKMRSWATIVDGTRLREDNFAGGLIGVGLAQILNIGVGDSLIALSTEGGLNAIEVEVQGIFETGNYEYDKRAVILTLENAQMLWNVDGIKSISILLDDTDNTNLVASNLQRIFVERDIPVTIKTWMDDAVYYRQVSGFLSGLFSVIKFIVMVIIAIGIANAILMSVMERTREIGTLNSIGFTTHQIIRLFLTEATFLGIIGGLIGCLVGILLTKWLATMNIFVPPPPGSSTGFPLMPIVVPREVLFAFGSSVVISIISAIYPATLASRMKPVDALRHI